MLKKLYGKAVVVLAGTMLAAPAAFAQFTPPTFDVSNAVSTIEAGLTPVGTLGVAAIVLVAAVGIWKKLRGAAR